MELGVGLGVGVGVEVGGEDDLVAVAMPLGDDGGAAVDCRPEAVGREVCAPAAEAHRAPHLLGATLWHEEHRLLVWQVWEVWEAWEVWEV